MIMPSEKSQTQKATYYMVPFACCSGKAKLWGQKSDQRLPGTGVGGRGLTIEREHFGMKKISIA